ncbi:hypothetical protein [Miltoncostaea marina]|uniref:hypothetical protein n=1 Tax=Miltoncostaea marina TaxID=2843215 RepID=UPI001C3C7B06|nr:hypothetical protein [Miltoncostaea marina]
MRHSHTAMWWCAAAAAGVVAMLVALGAGGWALLGALGCLVMMGAMVLMMSRGMGDGG